MRGLQVIQLKYSNSQKGKREIRGKEVCFLCCDHRIFPSKCTEVPVDHMSELMISKTALFSLNPRNRIQKRHPVLSSLISITITLKFIVT